MTKRGKGRRLTKKQMRLLAGVWIGVVVLVGACVFLGILWALRATNEQQVAEETPLGEITAAPQGLDPTPTTAPDPGQVAATSVAGEGAAVEPTIPPRQDSSFGYGIQAQLQWNTQQTADQIDQLGLNWVKQQIRWADLETEPGNINWAAIDYIFEETAKHKYKVMVSVVDAPDWARSVTAEGKAGPPDDPQQFVNFVSQLIQRYPGGIHAVEVWNEMNIDREWYTAGGLSAAGYVDLIRPTAEAVHQIDPGIIIISGALSPTGWNDGVTAIDDFQYMQQLIAAGVLDYADCVGAHSNGINLPPDIAYDAGYNDETATFRGPFENPHHSWSFYSTLTGYHDMIVAAGRDTPLCVTEFGWPTAEGMEGQPREDFSFALDNTLQEQADNIVRAYELMHDWGFVWLAFLFNLDYSPKAGGNPQDDSTLYSIVTPVGAPRPAYDAIRDMPKPP